MDSTHVVSACSYSPRARSYKRAHGSKKGPRPKDQYPIWHQGRLGSGPQGPLAMTVVQAMGSAAIVMRCVVSLRNYCGAVFLLCQRGVHYLWALRSNGRQECGNVSSIAEKEFTSTISHYTYEASVHRNSHETPIKWPKGSSARWGIPQLDPL